MATPKPNDELIKLRTKSSGVTSSLKKGSNGITMETSSSVKPPLKTRYRDIAGDNRFIEKIFGPVADSAQSKPKSLVKKIKDNKKNMAG